MAKIDRAREKQALEQELGQLAVRMALGGAGEAGEDGAEGRLPRRMLQQPQHP